MYLGWKMVEISCFFLEKIVYVCSGKVIIHERGRMGTTGIVHTQDGNDRYRAYPWFPSHPQKEEEKNMKKQITVGMPTKV